MEKRTERNKQLYEKIEAKIRESAQEKENSKKSDEILKSIDSNLFADKNNESIVEGKKEEKPKTNKTLIYALCFTILVIIIIVLVVIFCGKN